MVIDKEFKQGELWIGYNDQTHSYFNMSTGETLKGVTSTISKYKQPFDEAKWSLYKAWERVVGKTVFDIAKKKVGYESVVTYLHSMSKDRLADVLVAQAQIRREWKEKTQRSLEKGKLYHHRKEMEFQQETVMEFGSPMQLPVTRAMSFSLDMLDSGVYPEFMVVDPSGTFSGQIDKLLVDRKRFVIRDYKTNEKLDFESFKHVKMLSPFDAFDDCSFYHYTLQLNLYASMIEAWGNGLKCIGLFIDHVVDVENDIVKTYPVARHKELCDKFLESQCLF